MTDNTGHTPNPYDEASASDRPYGQQAAYGRAATAEHPQAQTVFWLGIVGIFFGICSWIAWYLGGKAKKEIDNGAPYSYDGNLKVGHLLGKILGIIYLVGVVIGIVVIIIVIASLAATPS